MHFNYPALTSPFAYNLSHSHYNRIYMRDGEKGNRDRNTQIDIFFLYVS